MSLDHLLVPSRTILIGIAVSVVTSFLQSLGLTLQRKSHLLEGARTIPHPRPSYRRPLWLTGFALFVASSFCGTTLTISLLPVIVLAPLGSVTLISNAIFAKAILGDRFSPQAIVATCLVVAGGLLVGAFGTIPLPTHSLEDLLNLYRRPAFITYFSLLELGVFLLMLLAFSLQSRIDSLKATQAPNPLSTYPSSDSTMSSDPTIPLLLPADPPSPLDDTALHPHSSPSLSSTDTQFFVPQGTSCTQCGSRLALPHLELLCGLLYGILSGMISSQSLLFTKSGIELLLITLLEGDNQFGNPVTWLIVGALVFTALLQLYYLNRGLELCDTLILAPLAFCSYNVSTLFNGLVYYNQFRALQHFQLLLVLVGVLVLSAGVIILSLGNQPSKPDTDSLTLPAGPFNEPITDTRSGRDGHLSFNAVCESDGASVETSVVSPHLPNDLCECRRSHIFTGSQSWWDLLGRLLPSRTRGPETQPLLQ
ncbi:hypothetical protein H4R33_005522 [Dimargaris cristalligena]|nr:hypothetical protein H4R33_005522 [Dimargaris cristalligena]